ncbi:MAG: hypothetical protein MUO30_12070 [Anaerolineales bacterium]|nr:hypothetical protein [Anaerolineales bacterium]
MNKTFTEWSVTTTKVPITNFIGTTDVSLAELAMRQVNRFFENLGENEEELLQRFEQNRGEAFERFYGSMDAHG